MRAPRIAGGVTVCLLLHALTPGAAATSVADGVVVRQDIFRRFDKDGTRRDLIAFALVSDVHQGDEELTLPSRTNWRDWAAVAPHMANAQVKAINTIASDGTPRLDLPLSMVFSLGDAADNAQYNETRLATDIFDGGKLVDPNSGARGYDDRREPDKIALGGVRSPVRGQRILDLANERFYAPGVRKPNGDPLPWYAVHGNHNVKVMGGLPHDDPAWRKVAGDWAVGNVRIANLNARLAGELARIREHAPEDEVAFWTRAFALARTDPASVGDVRRVPADDGRRLLNKQSWIDSFAKTSGAPKGHGFLPAGQRCPDAYDPPFERRACFFVDHGRFRFIALDDSPLEGFTTGSIDREQFAWLEALLEGSSQRYYDDDGKLVTNIVAIPRYVIVLSHHTSKGLRNSGTADELEGHDLRKLLVRFPNVLLHASGHSHSNRVWAHEDERRATGYWEVSTPSVIDHPHEGRTVEVADNGDGTLSIFTTPFRPAVGADPRAISWTKDDPTDEIASGADARINEDWLAAAGFHASAANASPRRYGAREDRAVELVIADPAANVLVATRAGRSGVRTTGSAAVVLAVIALFLRRRRRVSVTRPAPPAGATREAQRRRVRSAA